MNPNNPNPYQLPQSEVDGQSSQFVQPIVPTNPSLPHNNYQSPTQYPLQPAEVQKGMFKGRLNRVGFLLSFVYILVYFLIPIALQLAARGNLIVNVITLLFGIVGVVLVIPASISVGIRRWHDLNQSGWLLLLGLIPFVGFILLIIYLFVPGTKTPNRYGDIDNRPSNIGKVLLGK